MCLLHVRRHACVRKPRSMSTVAKRWPISATAEHLYQRSPKDGSPYAIGSSSVMSVLGRGLEAYLHTKWHLHPYSRLAQQTWAKNWGLCSFGERELSNTMWPGLRPTSIPSGILIHPAVWHNRHGPKIGGRGCTPLRGSWVPTNTMSSTSIPSFIVSHPTVWPQYTNVTDRTDRQTDNGLIA